MAERKSASAEGAMVAGLEDLQEKQRVRWARAERYAAGVADNGMGQALRIYYTRYFPAGVLIVVGLVIGVFALLPGPINWGFAFQLLVFVLTFGAGTAGLIYNSKRLAPRANLGRSTNMGVLFALDKDERKLVQRQISGKAPLNPDHLQIARGAAVQLRKGSATPLLVAPFWLYPLATIDGWSDWFMVLVLAGMSGIVVWAIVDFRRKGRFLDRTDDMVQPDGK